MILSLSGGVDSTSLLYAYKDQIKLAVSFKYGSNHETHELKKAKKHCKKLGIEHKVIDLTKTFKNFKSALLSGASAVPNAEYNDETIKSLVVPFRNGIFLSILAGIADSVGEKQIALASHQNDSAVYPDCRPEFSKVLDEAIRLGTESNVEFFRPFNLITKGEIVYTGLVSGLDITDTYSCYKGGDKPCGVCPTCVDRREAIRYALSRLDHEIKSDGVKVDSLVRKNVGKARKELEYYDSIK